MAIARRAFGQTWLSATAWAVAFGGTAASSALTYVSSFPTAASRRQIAATTAHDAGLSTILGPVGRIDTVGGYTTYKSFVFLTSIGAIWALLRATRLLRGEEEAGRWSLLLAGATRAPRATAATLAAIGAAVAAIYVGTTALVALAGTDGRVGFGFGESAVYGLSIVLVPAVFVGVGAVTSQLCRTRRAANGLGAIVLGIAFVTRMVADSSTGTHWLRWATPFGWSELMWPLTRNDLGPLVPAAVLTAALSTGAVVLAGRRDVDRGILASHDAAPLRPFGLGSMFGLAVRRERATLASWVVGAGATGFLLGLLGTLTTAKVPDSFGNTLDRFGVQGSFTEQYFGVAFLLVATVIALLPAGQIGAAADEELSGRLVHLLVGPVRRAAWFGGRLALAVGGIAGAAVVAGAMAWAGARSQGVAIDLPTMLRAGLNTIPIALVALGFGALLVALSPRIAGRSVYAAVVWSLLADLVGSMVSSATWLGRLSLLHYLALAPSQPIEPTTIVGTLVVAAALSAAAVAVFARRDLRTT